MTVTSMSVGPLEPMVSFRSLLVVSFDELPVMPSEIASLAMVIVGLGGWEGRGPCVASKLEEDAGGGAPLVYGSAVGTLLWLGLSILENICDFVTGFYVRMLNVTTDCNVGDFGIGVKMTGDAVAHNDVGKCIHPGVNCVVEHAVARGVSAMKSSISLKMLDDNTHCALKK
jgi:hypothetical protein